MSCIRLHSFVTALLMVSSVQALSQCPKPFTEFSGLCLYKNPSQNYSWCEANLECSLMGGELANNLSSIRGQMSNESLWIGVSDLADERNTSRYGWQQILDNGLLPFNDSIWYKENPNNEKQDCLRIYNLSSPGSLTNYKCTNQIGYLCEFKPLSPPARSPKLVAWKRVAFKRTHYNPSSEYCYKDLHGMPSAVSCVAAAGRDANCRRALYNRRSRLCRLLVFTDAQVESEIENSEDWAKFSIV